jgi:hypothetical protein
LRAVLSLGYHDAVSRAIDGGDEAAELAADLTSAVIRARRGFRRDVASLVEAAPKGQLFVPLMRRIEDVPVGVETELGAELSIAPHILYDEDRRGHMVCFTRPEFVEAAAKEIDLRTDGGELEYCTLPSAVVLEIALEVVDGTRVVGLLVNALHESELILRRHEVASIAQGKAIPLVGYVSEIPFSTDEKRLIAKLDGPPPEELVDAVESVLSSRPAPPKYGLHRTFSPERDLEPHFTLNLITEDHNVDSNLARDLSLALEGKLPPPGYIDIVWNDVELGEGRSRG